MLSVLDMAYLPSSDVLAILRSDQCVEFFKFLSRANYSSETIEHLGKITLAQPCHRICWRSMDNRNDRLMAIGTYNEIHHWLFVPVGDQGVAELKDHKTMEKHTDYVRALLTVNTYFAKYIISASLDKTVVLWDLASFEFRSVRTGHSAGVESLAFGGKNFLFAGGYDYSIIVWDLEAAINRPLFHLHGHTSCVTRIVAMESIERCASLDEEGNLFWWDISKNTPGATSTNRFIDKCQLPEDRGRTFDIFSNLPYNYMALHGVIFVTGGRRQHVFKLKDCNVQESAPVCTLYSQDLLSVYTIHAHDVIFWSAVNAYQHKVIGDLVGTHSRITCGILDDRRRRMILGDSNGVVRFFNCLNGVCLKEFNAFVSPVKSLIYCSDKNVIVLLDNSDVMILDDMADGGDSDAVLREVRFPAGSMSEDLICMAFSQHMGILVTVDVMGMLIVWDYAYLTPIYILPNASGNDSEVGCIQFIGDYPLLLLVDNSKNFSVISFETLVSNKRVEIWRLDTTLSPLIAKEGDEPAQDLADDDDDDDSSGGDSGARAKPFLYQKAMIFKRRHAEAKRMVVHLEDDDEDEEEEGGDEADVERTAGLEAAGSSQAAGGEGGPKFFPPNLLVHAVCGYDDGTMFIADLTSALRNIDIGPLTPDDCVHDQLGYNAKLKGSRHLGESDAKRILSEEEIQNRERFDHATIDVVWKPHAAAVVSLSIVGEYNWILTASEDRSIQLWDIKARFCGLLTRGSAMDKLFRNVWNNPEDMELRSMRRIGIARQWITDLQLEHVPNDRKGSTDSTSSHSLQRLVLSESAKIARERLTNTDPRDLVKVLDENPVGGLGVAGGGSVTSTDIYQSMSKVKAFPDRTRLICQFDGHMTYDPSKKDIAQIQLRASATLPALRGTRKKRRRRKRRLSADQRDENNERHTKEDLKYLQTIKIADQCLAMSSSKPVKTVQIGKWHYETEMAAIEAQDPSNWDITSSNRLRDMYPRHHEAVMERGVETDRNKIIESKIKHLCPNGNLRDYLEYLRGAQEERKRRRRKGKTKEAITSAHVDMYTFGDGKIITVSEDIARVSSESDLLHLEGEDADRSIKDGVLADDDKNEKSGIASVSSVAASGKSAVAHDTSVKDGVADEDRRVKSSIAPDEESVGGLASTAPHSAASATISELSVPLLAIEAPSNRNPPPDRSESKAKTTSPMRSGKQQPLSKSPSRGVAASVPLKKSPSRVRLNIDNDCRNETASVGSTVSKGSPASSACRSRPSSPERQMSKQKSLSDANLLDRTYSRGESPSASRPRSPEGPVETRAEMSRRITQELLTRFDQRLEQSEIDFRRANRHRKKGARKKTVAAAKLAESASERLSPKDGAEVDHLPKHKTFDEMLDVGKTHLRAESNWVRKVKAELTGSRNVKKAAAAPVVEISKYQHRPNRRETSIRLFRSMVETQKSEEERLKGRQYFGPYKTFELVQFFDVYLTIPKKQLTGTEVILTATNKPDEAEETRDGTGGCVSLHDLLRHKYVRSRPHFKAALEKNLLSRVGATAANTCIYMTLQRILVQMCPLMTTSDRKDCIQYFAICKSGLQVNEESEEVYYTAKQMKQLRQIFEFFDTDKSGTVDRAEIRRAVNRDSIKAVSASDNLRGSDTAIATGMDEASLQSMMDEGDVDNNDELDFDEFVKLFGSMYQ
jgi:WD40 repeat protein